MRTSIDTALVDRTKTPILGIKSGDQPQRPMTIPGIEGSLHAKILSTNLKGASTRLVRMDAGWGSRLAGGFTADMELFVLAGDLVVGPLHLTEYEYIAIPANRVVGRFRSDAGAIALMMTSAPVRYDTSTGGAPASPVVGRPAVSEWSRSDHHDEYVRPVASGPNGEVWLGSSTADQAEPLWHRHTGDLESFVLEGSLACLDLVEDSEVVLESSAGSYFYRPAGTLHTVARISGEETLITFNRSQGAFETEVATDGDIASLGVET